MYIVLNKFLKISHPFLIIDCHVTAGVVGRIVDRSINIVVVVVLVAVVVVLVVRGNSAVIVVLVVRGNIVWLWLRIRNVVRML